MAIPYIILGILLVGLLFRLTTNYADKNANVSRTIRIFLTNWVHFVGFYVSISLTTLINNFVDHGEHVSYVNASAIDILLSAPILLTIFAFKYIGLAIIAIFLMDMLSLLLKWRKALILTLTQWLIISGILIFIKGDDMDTILLTLLVLAFLATQIIRIRQLEKIVKTLPNNM